MYFHSKTFVFTLFVLALLVDRFTSLLNFIYVNFMDSFET